MVGAVAEDDVVELDGSRIGQRGTGLRLGHELGVHDGVEVVHHLTALLHAHDGPADVVEHGGEAQAHADDGDGHERLHGSGDGEGGGQADHGHDDDLAQCTVDDVTGGLPLQGAP
nr:hypothetical protein [Actinomyces viscosus]